VTDLAADASAGDTTFAVRFGSRFAHRLGTRLWASALALSLLCAWLDVVVLRSTLIPQLLMAPILVTAYAVLTRRPTITKLALLSVLFGIPTVGFALAYIG
jgi:4-hydroxybenzoate polyprenyltransferase